MPPLQSINQPPETLQPRDHIPYSFPSPPHSSSFLYSFSPLQFHFFQFFQFPAHLLLCFVFRSWSDVYICYFLCIFHPASCLTLMCAPTVISRAELSRVNILSCQMTMVMFQTCEGDGGDMGILPVSELINNHKSRCAVKQIHLVVSRNSGGK